MITATFFVEACIYCQMCWFWITVWFLVEQNPGFSQPPEIVSTPPFPNWRHKLRCNLDLSVPGSMAGEVRSVFPGVESRCFREWDLYAHACSFVAIQIMIVYGCDGSYGRLSCKKKCGSAFKKRIIGERRLKSEGVTPLPSKKHFHLHLWLRHAVVADPSVNKGKYHQRPPICSR